MKVERYQAKTRQDHRLKLKGTFSLLIGSGLTDLWQKPTSLQTMTMRGRNLPVTTHEA